MMYLEQHILVIKVILNYYIQLHLKDVYHVVEYKQVMLE